VPRGRPGKVIDNLRWDSGVSMSFSGISAGSSALTALSAGVPRETVMRTRGEVSVGFDGTLATARGVLVSMGMVLVPEGQGTTVIWDPFNDAEVPWFWYQEVALFYEESVVDVVQSTANLSSARIIVDSKAMRRANVDQEAQFVMTNTTIFGAQAVNVAANFRFLLGS